MIRAIFIFLLTTAVGWAVDEPRVIAEESLAAWRAGDAKRLEAIVHPELVKRFRTARIARHYVEGNTEGQRTLAVGSDSDVLVLFCAALRAIVPRDERVEYFDRFVATRTQEELTIVSFESGWRSRADPTMKHSSIVDVVLKKSGERWCFLWTPSARLHIDLSWDPKR